MLYYIYVLLKFIYLFIYFYAHIIFYNESQVFDCLIFPCLINKEHVNPRLRFTNVAALNYLLRSQIFVNDDGQLQVAHLILDYEPLSRSFQQVGNTIKTNDYWLDHIDVSRPNFLVPHDLPLVDHPIPQGVPLVA